ncbi:hypothetical protein GOHSU_13_00200 [Gordonia hirsuta DSM 44140 = NBRC 16056]|uniref:Uncharacterized protein n=2 Tax=Gordonia hirsuta TaxID=53427 RepID=L7L9T0_9ACTN|nr:hypothetical protein GOHSU_13_00200 [Gordonia hirsuta DSM 44140 = NBRC 16056]
MLRGMIEPMQRVSGFLVIMVALGFAGIVWMIVDIVDLGWGEVPGSTYACGVLGAVLSGFALYREFGGQPIVSLDPYSVSPAEQYEEQKKHDGLS